MSSDERQALPISILLVEDDAPTSWRLQDALAKAGYQVRAAATLAEARACLAQSEPRVLLTDLQLPDGHGVDLIRETRARFPDTEIMVISILGDEESVISAITDAAGKHPLRSTQFDRDRVRAARERARSGLCHSVLWPAHQEHLPQARSAYAG